MFYEADIISNWESLYNRYQVSRSRLVTVSRSVRNIKICLCLLSELSRWSWTCSYSRSASRWSWWSVRGCLPPTVREARRLSVSVVTAPSRTTPSFLPASWRRFECFFSLAVWDLRSELQGVKKPTCTCPAGESLAPKYLVKQPPRPCRKGRPACADKSEIFNLKCSDGGVPTLGVRTFPKCAAGNLLCQNGEEMRCLVGGQLTEEVPNFGM